MALDISALANIEKNKLGTSGVWAVLMKIILPDTTIIRVGSDNQDVVWPATFEKSLLEYTEVDPNSRLTVAALQVTLTNMSRNEQTYLVYDLGTDFFHGDFRIDFGVNITAGQQSSKFSPILLTNSLHESRWFEDNAGDYLGAYYFRPTTLIHHLRCAECDGGNIYSSADNIDLNTMYYCSLERLEGTGTYGTLYLKIYTDSDRTILKSTLPIPLHTSKKDFRYLMVAVSNDINSNTMCSAIVSNVKIVPSASYTWTRFPFELDEIGENSKGEVPGFEVRVGNTTRIMQTYMEMEGNEGGVGSEIVLYVVNTNFLFEPDAEVTLNFEVKDSSCDDMWAHFTIGAPNPFNNRYPRNRLLKNFCRYDVFGGDRCQYAGAETSCNRTITRCRALGNSNHFGGAPGAGRRGIYV